MTIQLISIVIVAGIAFYFLRQENKKQRKYFGKKVELNPKEKKVIEKYRQEYEPIKPDERLANLDKDNWELEDIARTATEIIFDSPIPKKRERQNLKTGDLVKLKFVTGDNEVERIWVRVIEKKEGLFLGQLDNDPFDEVLKSLRTIWFHPNHVFKIEKKSSL